MNKKPTLASETIDAATLVTVTGGTGLDNGPKPIQIGTLPNGMAPPKYSAGWWDFVRSNGSK